MKFTVDRKTWLRGMGGTNSALLRSRNRCCLGFLGQACGIPDAELHQPMPSGTHLRVRDFWPEWLVVEGVDSPAGQKLAQVNDDVTRDDIERERELTDIFASHGVEVEFTG